MKTTTMYQNAMFLAILGLAISYTVIGQPGKPFNNKIETHHCNHFLSDQQVYPGLKTAIEPWQLPYKSTQGSIPQEINHFFWANTSVWMADFNRIDSYNTSGKILSEIYIDANTGDTTYGVFYTYDSQGRIDNLLLQNWVNSNWENAAKQMYTYDIHGNDEVYLELTWTGTGWDETSGRKYVYTYDANNHITVKILQFWDAAGDFWYNYDKYLYNYNSNGYVNEYTVQWWLNNNWSSIGKELYTLNNAGVITEILLQTWNNNTWGNSSMQVDIVWHVWNGYFNEPEQESYLQKSWNSGVWEDSERMNTTYDAYGGWIQLEEYYSNNAWVNASKLTTTCDTHCNFTGFTYEMWNGFAWTIDYGYNNILTYDSNDVIECIFQSYDHALSVWYNTDKEQYSNFIYTQGIGDGGPFTKGISLFPNPTSGIINIEVNDKGLDIQSVEIVSLSGKVVYQQQLNKTSLNAYKVDLTTCAKGVYFIKIHNSSGITTGKIIVQ